MNWITTIEYWTWYPGRHITTWDGGVAGLQRAVGLRDSPHDDVIKWKHFPRYWPFVRGIHQPAEFPTQRPVTRSFDVFFDLRLNKPLSKQSWVWWFETLPAPLWRHSNAWDGTGVIHVQIGTPCGYWEDAGEYMCLEAMRPVKMPVWNFTPMDVRQPIVAWRLPTSTDS